MSRSSVSDSVTGSWMLWGRCRGSLGLGIGGTNEGRVVTVLFLTLFEILSDLTTSVTAGI